MDRPEPYAHPHRPKIPDIEELRQRVPKAHPRILFRPGDFDRLKEKIAEPSFDTIFQSIREQADAMLGRPLQPFEFPPDFYDPDLETWHARFARSAEGIEAMRKVQEPLGVILPLVQSSALVYRLQGDARYLDQARRAMLALADLDLTVTSYVNTHSFAGVVATLAEGLNILWDDLETGERETIADALTARATEFHPLSVGEAMGRDPGGLDPQGSVAG